MATRILCPFSLWFSTACFHDTGRCGYQGHCKYDTGTGTSVTADEVAANPEAAGCIEMTAGGASVTHSRLSLIGALQEQTN